MVEKRQFALGDTVYTVQTLYIHVYQVTLLILVNSDISRTNSSSLKSGYEILSTSILSSEKNCMYVYHVEHHVVF